MQVLKKYSSGDQEPVLYTLVDMLPGKVQAQSIGPTGDPYVMV
jgi:hypothetical protein